MKEEFLMWTKVWGVEVEENYSEEFPFENFKNTTSGNSL